MKNIIISEMGASIERYISKVSDVREKEGNVMAQQCDELSLLLSETQHVI